MFEDWVGEHELGIGYGNTWQPKQIFWPIDKQCSRGQIYSKTLLLQQLMMWRRKFEEYNDGAGLRSGRT